MAIVRKTAAEEKKSIVSAAVNSADDGVGLENVLRPQTLGEYIGQTKIKEALSIFIDAAKKRGEPIEHTLLYGPPGLGKTTLASIIAREMGVNLRVTSGPAIEKQGDLASILTNLTEGDVLFIDEIHRLRLPVEEILYSAMEDYALDLVIGKGPAARSMRLALPKFTLIGATTKAGSLSAPLRDRFGASFRLHFYENSEMAHILERSAAILGVPIEGNAIETIAAAARATPRIANRLLKRLRDIAEVRHEGAITVVIAESGLAMLGVDPQGLDHLDRAILSAIAEKFSGGPVGLSTLAAALSEETETIEAMYEPYLLQLGFIARTPRGRVLTPHAYRHLGLPVPRRIETIDEVQESLL